MSAPNVRFCIGSLVAALSLGGFAACSSRNLAPLLDEGATSPARTAAGSTGGDDGGATCPATAEGGCNGLGNCGTEIHVVQNPIAAPAPTGGTIAAGTYVMTTYTIYTGVGGASGTLSNWFRETMTFTTPAAGATQAFDWNDVSETDQSATATSSGTIVIAPPASLTIEIACESASTFPASYTATSASLILYYPDSSIGTAEVTYTLSGL
jgi:hypothetical protein